MHFRDMTDPQLTGDLEYQYLADRLEKNDVCFKDTKLPKGCIPDTAKVTFSKNKGVVLSLEPQISYSGPDASFATLCLNQRMVFQNLDKMKIFLRSMKLEEYGSIISKPDCTQKEPSTQNAATDSNGHQTQKKISMDDIMRCRTAAIAVLNYVQASKTTG